ncbi:hypothetical protein V7S79_12205, partial [Aquirufa sp. ROCK-SH2]
GSSGGFNITTGSGNISLGNSNLISGSNNTIIGGTTTSLNIGASNKSNIVALGNGAGSVRVFADSLGLVGINTIAPTNRLTVYEPNSTAVLGLYYPAANAPAAQTITGQINVGTSNSWFTTIRSVIPATKNQDQQNLEFTTGNATNDNTQISRMTILSQSGNVGIGTNIPASKLEVNGTLGGFVRTSSVSTTTSNDFTLLMTGAGTTVTLEAPTSVNKRIMVIKNTSTGIVTVTGHLDGTASTSIVLISKESIEIQSDGSTWQILAKYNSTNPLSVTAQLNPVSIAHNTVQYLASFTNVSDNSQGAWNASTGVYTSNKTGTYRIEFRAMMASASWNQNAELALVIEKNGVTLNNASWFAPFTGTQYAFSGYGYATTQLAVGDKIRLALYQASGTAKTTYNMQFNVFSIYEIR